MRAVEMQQRIEAGADRSAPAPTNAPKDITWGLRSVKDRSPYHDKHRNYYKGEHALMIRREKLRTVFGYLFRDFNLNMCKVVVDALANRLAVESFSVEQGTSSDGDLAWKIWEKNRMARRVGQLLQEAIVTGDSYLMVWPNDARPDIPILYPQRGDQMSVEYDKDVPGKINKAVKLWTEPHPTRTRDGKPVEVYYMNLYYPDRIERWQADKPSQGDPKPEDFKHRVPLPEQPESWRTFHKWGEVPVYHFANNADLGEFGVSELEDAIKVQDMANYLAFSLLVGVEFAAMPQKYLMNIEKPIDPETGQDVDPLKSGVEHIWTLTTAAGENMPQGSVGQLPPADLSQLSAVMDFADRKMATITGTPIHYFYILQGMQAAPASGEAQKIAEFKLDKKVEDRQTSFGDTLAKAMAMAVKMSKAGTEDGTDGSGGNGTANSSGSAAGGGNARPAAAQDATAGDTAPEELELGTNWKDTRPRNETEVWTVAGLKRQAGVSQKQVLREAGYTERQITKMEGENQKAAEAFGLGGPASSPDSPQGQQARGVKPPTPQEQADKINNTLDSVGIK